MDALRSLSEEQHGLLSRAQCRALGLSPRGDVRRDDLERLSPRVLRLVGAPRTTFTDVMAAVLDAGPGAAASHDTAAALWGLSGFDLLPAQVVRHHDADRHRPVLGRLHKSRHLPPDQMTVVHGIPVTTPARTLFDLAGTTHPARIERAVDNAVAASPALLRALHRLLPELAERGRPGIRAMRAVLEARPPGTVLPASALERRVVSILARAGIATQPQVDLGGDDWLGRVDLLVLGTRLVIEVDSARFHSSLLDRRRDAERDAALRALGYDVLRVTEEEAWHAPATVVARVRGAVRNAA